MSGERGDADLAAADLYHQFWARAARLAQEPEHDSDEVAFEGSGALAVGLLLVTDRDAAAAERVADGIDVLDHELDALDRAGLAER